ncbi:hypothetical protein [Variovorax paradoxus]|uniref:Uncharacterized protein n=1 Tax=Variovorax paradoxus (strain EPS) TaxID=595537 RepID=E6V3U1_VARPE|nr:hypothetical protein [Variovorax paradoxus]ADU36965.1 hypothetical protein Varpa_2767 [Variovorax paradoxus EPS]
MSHIRRISVHVDEPDPGHFYWVLMEEGDDASQWVELQSAEEGFDMWLDALQAGMWALEKLAEDERVGPAPLATMKTPAQWAFH